MKVGANPTHDAYVASWKDRVPAGRDGNQGKHRVTKRGPALSYPMFTLVTGIVGRWRAVCVTALQRPNSDAAAIRIVVGIAAASLSVTVPLRRKLGGNRLMRDMAQLRLQLEVSQLEGTLQQPKSQSAMSPYLIPDTQALCQHLNVIRQLANSGRFIIIIPQTVIDGLDFLKKENAGARDGIRYLETEFKKGNRYIRCQKEAGKSFERNKLKRQDTDAWHLYKILDSCKQLTVSQGSNEEETAGMVTIITGFQLDDPECFSPAVQSALQAVSGSSIEMKNVVDFYKQWKEMG
ncbi:unnamed protein product [Ranitomeya imitator]|uniref:PIN domain-containing protein n=1 Tax=Ranitomeya imitator TaxID=111125 RepID=A0ABN9MPZ1_9NEOB|nr:unnamed protein product [Ranitomeya imitator]